jgi:hypothetical protein
VKKIKENKRSNKRGMCKEGKHEREEEKVMKVNNECNKGMRLWNT